MTFSDYQIVGYRPSEASVYIQLGDGNLNADISAKNASIVAGNGSHDLNAQITNDLFVDFGCKGYDSVAANVGGNAQINLGGGDADVVLMASNAAINGCCGDFNIAADIKNDLSITLGDGVDNIWAKAGDDAVINVGNGATTIDITTGDDLNIYTGEQGRDIVKANAGGDAVIATYDGCDNIDLTVGGSFQVQSGVNEPSCCDNDIVRIHGNLDNPDTKNLLILGDGADDVRFIANGTEVFKDDGSLEMGFYGDNTTVQSDAENNKIGFWGDETKMLFTDKGNFDIKTLDFSFANKEFTDFGFQDILAKETFIGSTSDTVVTRKLTGENNLDEIAKEYKLTAEQTAQLKSLDLNKTTKNGQPYYLIYQQNNKYEIGYRDDAGNTYDMSGNKLNFYDSHSSTSSSTSYAGRQNVGYGDWILGYDVYKTTTTTTNWGSSNTLSNIKNLNVEQEVEMTTEKTRTDYYNIDGVKDLAINFCQDGNYDVGVTARDGLVSIVGQNDLDPSSPQKIVVRGGYVAKDKNVVSKEIEKYMEKLNLSSGNLIYNSWNNSSSSTSQSKQLVYSINVGDPIVLDTNKDGFVSAKRDDAGFGVDINGDGKADGAAAEGDKMLAMSDLNKNGQIDGSEVFGDQTVSPFTGEKLNAKNGFEALKMIAQEAEARGFKCIENGYVNMEQLAKALATKGVKLGLISGDNNKTLESANDIKFISLNYVDMKDENGEYENNDIQHRQRASYIDAAGKSWNADDVWYKV